MSRPCLCRLVGLENVADGNFSHGKRGVRRELLLQSTRGHALNDLPLKGHEDENERSGGENARGEREAVFAVVGRLVKSDAHRKSVVADGIEKDERADEIVPTADECKHTECRHRRCAEWKRDMQE